MKSPGVAPIKMNFLLRIRLGLGCLVLAASSCSTPPQRNVLQLVETTPVGTVLGSMDLPETASVWRGMLASARHSIELSHFYLVSDSSGLLEGVIARLEAAARRGVRVRILVGEKFYATYPELIDRFQASPDIEIRRINFAELAGGVQHAKYMIVDGWHTFVGSPNFDWRALEHIQELGVRIESPELARSLLDVFEYDWALAAGEQPPAPLSPAKLAVDCLMDRRQVGRRYTNAVRVRPAFSPTGWLPHESDWDLPEIQSIIDDAQRNLYLQVLTLDLVDRDGVHFEELEDALVRAAARGVRVRIVVADWSDRAGVIEDLRGLASLPEIGIRMISIPEHSGGHIPFARVVHAKYLVADRSVAWLGSSNWERGYFFDSRNVGWVFEGEGFADRLEHYFRSTWSSPYAREVLPAPQESAQ